MEIAYDERGLVPVVVQDWRTGEVLTLAYANAEAVRRTRESGELHLWSRSRREHWHKGATSGNVQRVRALRLDCDGDALALLGGLQQERRVLRVGAAELQERRDGRLEIVDERVAQRDEVVLARERAHLVE